MSSTYPDPGNRERTIARSEVERRQPYMAKLEAQIAQSHPILLELIKQCLHNAPERRPSSEDILSILETAKEEMGEKRNIPPSQQFGCSPVAQEMPV